MKKKKLIWSCICNREKKNYTKSGNEFKKEIGEIAGQTLE